MHTINTTLRRLLWAIEQQRADNAMRAAGELADHLVEGHLPDLYLFHLMMGELLATLPDRLARTAAGRRASDLAVAQAQPKPTRLRRKKKPPAQ